MVGRVLGLVVLLLLAGCSSPRNVQHDDEPQVAAPPVDPGTASNPTASTLHFRARPTMSTVAPTWGEPFRVPVPSITDDFVTTITGLRQSSTTWNFQWPGGAVSGNGTIWVDVQGPLAHSSQSCFWELVFDFDDMTGTQGFRTCVADEPASVPQGQRRLDFEFQASDSYPAGEVSLQLVAGAGPNPPETEVVLLAGSPKADSQLTFLDVSFS